MTEIHIRAIFNQDSPKLWHSIHRIGTAAMFADYGYNEIANIDIWKNQHNDVMLGAYDGDTMVGFTIGNRQEDGIMHIEGLYVLPEYQSHGIGARLLNSAENACAVFKPYAELTALTLAQPFYVRHGWTVQYSNVYQKKLIAKCAIVPVFKILPRIARAYSEITGGYNIRNDMRPGDVVYIYVNAQSKISAMAIGRPDKRANRFKTAKVVVANGTMPTIGQTLARVIDKLVVRD